MTSDADSPMANLRRQNGRDEPWKIKYFGVGNESWGCGGNMRPEYYADLYRRYNTFVKNYSGNNIYRIACGASGANYQWTEVLMSRAGRKMNGLSLHYYTIPSGNWGRKGSATDFDESVYHATLKRTLQMEELVTRHSEIMDKHDPEKRVGMVIDEWGVWTDVEPGTNPGFLYQQNSLRDAIVAGLNLHIFHGHADRISMTNIAQTINVLQAMILTDKERMLRTPTYHVFEMFKVHQDGVFLPIELETPDYTQAGESIPAVSASATRDDRGNIHLSLINTDANREMPVRCSLRGTSASTVSGRFLTATKVNSHNTFDQPGNVRPEPFTEARIQQGTLTTTLPAKSIVVLKLSSRELD
jgi:alpha-N-arabinofuranosidase